ncbi:unnamed protein product [Caenorhabditis sp. 36 PRJEB53466]|nr:unnamed protein product [Caenorhabditis sp. 36 PRJEB53466]
MNDEMILFFFTLPLLAWDVIIENLEPLEIVAMAMYGGDFRRAAIRALRNLKLKLWMKIDLFNDESVHCEIRLHESVHCKERLVIVLRKTEMLGTMSSVKTVREDTNLINVYVETAPSGFMTRMYDISTYTSVSVDDLLISEKLDWGDVAGCVKLILKGQSLKFLKVEQEQTSSKILEWITEDVKHVEHIFVEAQTVEGLYFAEDKKIGYLYLENPQWISAALVKNINCSKLHIEGLTWFNLDIFNEFLHSWLQGGNENVTDVRIFFQDFRKIVDKEKVLRGLTAVPRNPSSGTLVQHSRYEKFHIMQYMREGMDIIRPDGTTATVDIQPGELSFHRW